MQTVASVTAEGCSTL